MRRLFLLVTILLSSFACAQQAISPEVIIEQVSPSVALVLAGENGKLSSVASAVVVRSDGVLLTALHAVEGKHELQVKFKNGETFDDVQLLGVDKRRDVAALRISASRLPVLPVMSLADVKPGAAVFVVSQAAALPWSASNGVLSAIRPADEVQGAGSGYRLLQFTAPVSPGSSGGVLVDGSGHLLGIVVASYTGQNLNFAVPVESVLGLAEAPARATFSSGNKLALPSAAKVAEEGPKEGMDLSGPEKSQAIDSRDPSVILKKFRTIYVRCNSVWMKDEVVKNALRQRPDFQKMGLVIVENPSVADAILTTDRVLFTWDFTYSLRHQNTSIVLASGKFTKFDGMTAAGTIADDLVKQIKSVRMPPGEDKEAKKPEKQKDKAQGE